MRIENKLEEFCLSSCFPLSLLGVNSSEVEYYYYYLPMFHGDVRVQTVPVLVCFSTGGAGVLDSLDVRLNMLLHVSSRLPASLRLSTNSAHPRSVPLSARVYVV